jgi:hypothetical protein
MPHASRLVGFAAVLALLCAGGRVAGQGLSPLGVSGLGPGGLRIAVTERWGSITFAVRNLSDAPREARVVVYHDGDEFSEYARDLWVPARAEVTAWMSVGPVPKLGPGGKPFSPIGRTLHFILYDRTDGALTVVRPTGAEKLRDRVVLYRPKSEWSTALFVDEPNDPDESSFRHPTPDAEAATIVRVMRGLRGQSEYLSHVVDATLPSSAESYDGIDQIVLASNRLKADPHARASLRQWVERGGQLWVMLDQVDAELLESLLGEECAPQVVDRTSLSRVRLVRASMSERPNANSGKTDFRDYERPVAFVRVALTGRETVHHYVDSWPAAFSIRAGRGRILVTTLGPHGWYRDRGGATLPAGPNRRPQAVADPPSPFASHPSLPVALDALLELSSDLKPVEIPFRLEDLNAVVQDEIGYRVPERGSVALWLGAFVAALAGIGVLLRRSRRTEIVGWLVPGVALGLGATFALVGGAARHAIPPTSAIAEVVDAVPGSGEVAQAGVFAAFEPSPGPVRLAAPRGGVIDFDFDGLEGQNRVRVQTDRDTWHYEKLAMPAGVRLGQYRATRTSPVRAVASFGPEGLSGRLDAPEFRDPTDAILVARNREVTAARFLPDGTFRIGADDLLARGQFLAGAVLGDRQQARQGIYRRMFGDGDGKTVPDHYDVGDFLLAWTNPTELPFTSNEASRAIGSSLLAVPIEYQRPAAGTAVFVPRAFLPFRRWQEGRLRAPTLDSTRPIDMRLRFQLPDSVLPLAIEKATLHVKVRAPSRRVILQGYENDKPVTILEQREPTGPIRVEIADARHLKLDAEGGLHVGFAIAGDANVDGGLESFWYLDSFQLEITGRTVAK